MDHHLDTLAHLSLVDHDDHGAPRVMRCFARPHAHPHLSPLDDLLEWWPSVTSLDCLRDRGNLISTTAPSLPTLDFPPSSSDAVRVVCDVPVLAPRPLPYHSPTFLQFDLPDTDEDLSHPPYTHRPHKRKRTCEPEYDIDPPQPKRRVDWRSRVHINSWDTPLTVHHSHRPCGNHRCHP